MLIDHLIAAAGKNLYLTCMSEREGLYQKFGFVAVSGKNIISRYFRRMDRLGSLLKKITRFNGMVMYRPRS